MWAAPAQRLAFFPQPDSHETGRWGYLCEVSPSCEGQSGERWHSVSLPVGLFNRWECPVGHFHHENDRTRNRGAVPLSQKETSVSGSPLVGATRQHQRGAGTETDNSFMTRGREFHSRLSKKKKAPEKLSDAISDLGMQSHYPHPFLAL